MRWSEALVHKAMRQALKADGWSLIAGEFPGGSDHELYPLNVVDPSVARDRSPDPRRHSQGEMIPDLVALKGRKLAVIEAKIRYNAADDEKLRVLMTERQADFINALEEFAQRYDHNSLFPINTLEIHQVLAFVAGGRSPTPRDDLSYLLVSTLNTFEFHGRLGHPL